MWLPKGDIVIARIPKAGIKSIGASLARYGEMNTHISTDEAREYPTRLAFLRNPFERLKSGYSFFNDLCNNGRNIHSNGEMHQISRSWESFVDYILAEPDVHWNPQVDVIEDAASNLHKFEDIQTVWSDYFPVPLQHRGKTARLPTDDYRHDDIAEFYKEDLKLWHSL